MQHGRKEKKKKKSPLKCCRKRIWLEGKGASDHGVCIPGSRGNVNKCLAQKEEGQDKTRHSFIFYLPDVY